MEETCGWSWCGDYYLAQQSRGQWTVVFACHVRLFAMPQAIRFGAGLGYCTNTIKMVHDPLSKAAPPLICLCEVLWMEAWVSHVLWQFHLPEVPLPRKSKTSHLSVRTVNGISDTHMINDLSSVESLRHVKTPRCGPARAIPMSRGSEVRMTSVIYGACSGFTSSLLLLLLQIFLCILCYLLHSSHFDHGKPNRTRPTRFVASSEERHGLN